MARKKKAASSTEADLVERLHPSLRAKFVPLPESGDTLTDEQLDQIFGGDLSALRDVIRLAQQNKNVQQSEVTK